MTDAPSGERAIFLSDLPAGRRDCAFACAVMVASTVIFLVLAPFAKTPLPPFPAFIPIYQAALFINDLITVAFLLGQSRFSRPKALNLLAGGYLFTALMSATHALTFPGLFAPSGLLDAGPQTTAWLYVFWHGGFPCFVIAYTRYGPQEQPSRLSAAAMLRRACLVVAAVAGFALIATLGGDFLPPIMQGNHYAPAAVMVVSSVWLLNLCAVVALSRRRPYTVLDLWLIVVLCAWLFDIALSAVFNAGRYDLGFYAGRIYGLVAASLVLIVLLHENGKLYLHLIKLLHSDREKAAELRRLSTIDALTGIANRRAFAEALDLEWRRMMRHEMPLALVLMDVDYFKRFNDSYGHVAGDQCLRAVAQAVAGHARRAGELAARYGGEEFAVLLPHTDLAAARALAERICASVREQRIPHAASEVAPHVTVSIGVASIGKIPELAAALSRDGTAAAAAAAAPAARPGPTVLIEAADHALYQAKTSGRNRVVAAGPHDALAAAAPAAAA